MNRLKQITFLILLVFLDQLTKFLLAKTKNYGAAFGILQGKTIFFVIISIIVIVLAILQLRKKTPPAPLILIISGAIGNLIDRILFGYVRDFIDLRFWPSFNIADSLLTIGLLWMIFLLIFKKDKNLYITKNQDNLR